VAFLLATDLLQELRQATNYRSFLKTYLQMKGLSGGAFAKQAGFVRQFPSDVMTGKRRLTLKSFAAFDAAMHIPPMAHKYFKHLVASEERDLFPELQTQTIHRVLQELRSQTWQNSFRKNAIKPSQDASQLFHDPSTLVIMSAVGTPEKGAQLEEIISRSGLSAAEVKLLLPKLVQAKIIRLENTCYFVDDFHQFLSADVQKEAFAAVFSAACHVAAQKASTAKNEDSEMFFTSFFCVDRAKLPELKAALRKTLLQFVDDSIQTDANSVVRLVAALHL
jgi:hypothetical protein